MIDSHTHSTFSPDGKEAPESMMIAAREKGIKYLATTEHYDMDYRRRGIDVPILDVAAYVKKHSELKEKLSSDDIYYATGAELGYDRSSVADCMALVEKYDFDVVVNSVHLVYGEDAYRAAYYTDKDKRKYYGDYFRAVRESLDVPYRYDIVGHIGYAMRYAPDKSLDEESLEQVRDIFKRIIELDKTLEINSHVKQTGLGSVPTREMLKLYKDLGGENVTFSSDAHKSERLCEHYREVSAIAKEIGFRYYTIFKHGKREKIDIE